MVTWQKQETRGWGRDEKLRYREATSLIHPAFPPRPSSICPFFALQRNQECKTLLFRCQRNATEECLPALVFHDFFLRFSRKSLGEGCGEGNSCKLQHPTSEQRS